MIKHIEATVTTTKKPRGCNLNIRQTFIQGQEEKMRQGVGKVNIFIMIEA